MIALWIVLGVGAAAACWMLVTFNQFVTLRNQGRNGWTQMDIQLKRRHDLIPNLVNTVKGAMEFEQDTLTQVMEARNRALTATGAGDAAVKETQLSGVLRQLLAVVENYPALTSNANVRQLQEELRSTEDRIGFARQFYNDIATRFNTELQTVPTNLVGRLGGFAPFELFQITAEAERNAPTVNLSLRKPA